MSMNYHEAQEIEYEAVRAHAPDFKLDILDAIFEPCDPQDFIGFAIDHHYAHALLLLGVLAIRSDLLTDDDVRQSLENEAKTLLDGFVDKRNEQMIDMWIEDNYRSV